MRLIHAVRELVAETGTPIETVALYTDVDRNATFVREADVAYDLGPASARPYIDLKALERALVETKADAAWVGWGFVAEDPANPGYDFGDGAHIFAFKDQNGRIKDAIGGGEKSGEYWALDPETGGVLWSSAAGPGGHVGGIMWGTAWDAKRIYVAEANFFKTPYQLPYGTTSSGSTTPPSTRPTATSSGRSPPVARLRLGPADRRRRCPLQQLHQRPHVRDGLRHRQDPLGLPGPVLLQLRRLRR